MSKSIRKRNPNLQSISHNFEIKSMVFTTFKILQIWGHSKKRLVELVTKKQKVHQAHGTSA
jgi:hypothetical protein